eukprot:3806403-Amphidinium_carterae.1
MTSEMWEKHRRDIEIKAARGEVLRVSARDHTICNVNVLTLVLTLQRKPVLEGGSKGFPPRLVISPAKRIR